MIVVADTSPLNYLVLLGHIGLLPDLFRSVIVPIAVLEEAANRRLIDLRTTLDRLRETSFHVDNAVFAGMLRRVQSRTGPA